MQRVVIIVRVRLSHHNYILADLVVALAAAQLKRGQVLVVPGPHVGRGLQDQADYGGVALVSRQVQGRIQIGVQQVEQRDHLELLQKVLLLLLFICDLNNHGLYRSKDFFISQI